jgi:hypothetical protein
LHRVGPRGGTNCLPCPTSPRPADQQAAGKEGEGGFSVAGHELAEHRSLADRLQAAAAGRDEGAFLDQIKHAAGAAGSG